MEELASGTLSRLEAKGVLTKTRNTESGAQDVFATGDRVFDGPKLVSVRETSAVVSYKGRRVTIEISEEEDQRMEEVVRDVGGLTEAQAVSTVEC